MLARLTGGITDAIIEQVKRKAVSVLVVDDLASFRQAATSVVTAAAGFAMAGAAESGEEAVAFLEHLRVDLVLMDVNMPGMGGIRAAEAISSRYPRVQVVLLSIHNLADLPAALASSGAQFCRKDRFSPGELEALWSRTQSTRRSASAGGT